jgi:hypothetical protein
MSLRTSTYFVDFAPAFFICQYTRDTGEAGEELLSKGVDQIGVGLSSVSILPRLVVMQKRRKSFTIARSGASTPLRS